MYNTKDFDFDLDTRSITDSGTFEGYGSVFSNVDLGNDRVMPGAFKATLERQKNRVPMLWSHQTRLQPIGIWEDLKEDSKGLFGKGILNLETQGGRETYSNLKMGALSGLSIGYRTVRETRDKDDDGVTQLLELDLKEISPVTFPMNTEALVSEVKDYEGLLEVAQHYRSHNPLPIKKFEEALREAGFSRSAATTIAMHGYAKLVVQGEPDTEAEATEFLSVMLKKLGVRLISP